VLSRSCRRRALQRLPATWDACRSGLPSCPSRRLAPGLLPGGEERLPGLGQRGDRLGCCLVPGLPNVRVCGQDLQLMRADRIISLLVPVAAGYGAASPDDRSLQAGVCADIEAGTGVDTFTRVKLADCGISPAGSCWPARRPRSAPRPLPARP